MKRKLEDYNLNNQKPKKIKINNNSELNFRLIQAAYDDDDMYEAKLLLENGPNIYAANESGKTALHIAAKEGHRDFIEFLLNNYQININAVTEKEETALTLAIKKNHVEVINLLINAGADVNCTGLDSEANNKSALCIAIALNRTEIVELLLNNGADVNNNKENLDENDESLICVAIQKGNKEIIKLLLEKGAYHETMLVMAVEKIDFEIVELLLNKYDDLAEKDEYAALCSAIKTGDEDIINLLFDYKINVNDLDGPNGTGQTALSYAITDENIKQVKNLIEKGTNFIAFSDGDYKYDYTWITNALEENLNTRNIELIIKAGEIANSIFNREDKKIIEAKVEKIRSDIQKFEYEFYNIEENNDSSLEDELLSVITTRLKNLYLSDNISEIKDDVKDESSSNENVSDVFIKYLQDLFESNSLPMSIKQEIEYIKKDYITTTYNIESEVLKSSYNIWAEEERKPHMLSPCSFEIAIEDQKLEQSFKPEKEINAENNDLTIITYNHIMDFCDAHPIYKDHSYLFDLASTEEIAKLMNEHEKFKDDFLDLYNKFANVHGVKVREVIEKSIGIFNVLCDLNIQNNESSFIGNESILQSQYS